MAKRKPTCKIETITPELAEQWLALNTNNFRAIDIRRVSFYAETMKRGQWQLNGETIIFRGDGTLVNGQHRLDAVVKSGTAIESFVVRGIDCDGRSLDRGKNRTIAQWLKHEGIKNGTATGKIAKLVLMHENGIWSEHSPGPHPKLTDTAVIDYALENDESIQLSIVRARRARGLICLTDLAGLLLLGDGGGNLAEWFADALGNGLDCSEEDAVYHLRRQLIDSAASKKKFSSYVARMLATVAWNRAVEDIPTKLLRLRLTGPKKQMPPNEVLIDRGK